MTIKLAISELLDGIRDAYRDDLKRFNTTEKASKSLRTEAKDTSGALYGAKYIYQLKYGRKPGKFPPIEAILNWIRDKRIQPNDGISERSLAFLISRKIAKKGTNIFQKKTEPLNVEDKIQELNLAFMKNLDGVIKKSISSSL